MKYVPDSSEFTRQRTAPLKEDVKQKIKTTLQEYQEVLTDLNSTPVGKEVVDRLNQVFTEEERQTLYKAVKDGVTAKLALPKHMVEKLEVADALIDALKTILGQIDDSPEELVDEDGAADPEEV